MPHKISLGLYAYTSITVHECAKVDFCRAPQGILGDGSGISAKFDAGQLHIDGVITSLMEQDD